MNRVAHEGTPVEALWHLVECGGYSRDLAIWAELAEGAGPVLELGAGTGRVSLHLARAGSQVTAVEREPELAAELERRVADAGLEVEVVNRDLFELSCGDPPAGGPPPGARLRCRFGLVIAAMQLIQMIPPDERPSLLELIADHLSPGGLAALAVVEPDAMGQAGTAGQDGASEIAAIPDIREIDGFVYSSRPLWVSVEGDSIRVTRERESVSPEGRTERSIHHDQLWALDPDEFEAAAIAAGLLPSRRIALTNGPAEADSTVIVLEAPR